MKFHVYFIYICKSFFVTSVQILRDIFFLIDCSSLCMFKSNHVRIFYCSNFCCASIDLHSPLPGHCLAPDRVLSNNRNAINREQRSPRGEDLPMKNVTQSFEMYSTTSKSSGDLPRCDRSVSEASNASVRRRYPSLCYCQWLRFLQNFVRFSITLELPISQTGI